MRRTLTSTAVLGSVIVVGFVACGGEGRNSGFDQQGKDNTGATSSGGTDDPNGDFGASGGTTDPGAQGCAGLQCKQTTCAGGATTSISGIVYDPAGKNPLYNVVVYVPNAPVAPLPEGATCDACNALYTGSPLVATTTDAAGKFTLKNMPVGKDIPLVIQVGKWRRQITIPNVDKCVDTALADKSVRLPKNQSEGNIPKIAISTGSADSLECLLRRVGVDASEYGGGASGTGRIHIFTGATQSVPIFGIPISSPNTNPPGPESKTGLWSSKAELMKYDIVLLSCEGSETVSMNQQALFDYAAAGGRVFGSHFHYSWFNSGPFGQKNLASWKAGTNDMGDIGAAIVTTLPNGQPFTKGAALKDWLGNVKALSGGELSITQAKNNADVGGAHLHSQAWIKANDKANPKGATQYFTFNTPIAAKAEDQCGRVVYSDLHVGAASQDYAGGSMTVPTACGSGDLSAQEKALEFMLFDLSSCVTPDDKPPPPPPQQGPK